MFSSHYTTSTTSTATLGFIWESSSHSEGYRGDGRELWVLLGGCSGFTARHCFYREDPPLCLCLLLPASRLYFTLWGGLYE